MLSKGLIPVLAVTVLAAMALVIVACPPQPTPSDDEEPPPEPPEFPELPDPPPPPGPPKPIAPVDLDPSFRLIQGDGGMPYLDRAQEVVTYEDDRFIIVANRNVKSSVDIFSRDAKAGILPYQDLTLTVMDGGGTVYPLYYIDGLIKSSDNRRFIVWDGENGLAIFALNESTGEFVQTDGLEQPGIIACGLRTGTDLLYVASSGGTGLNGFFALRIDPATATFTEVLGPWLSFTNETTSDSALRFQQNPPGMFMATRFEDSYYGFPTENMLAYDIDPATGAPSIRGSIGGSVVEMALDPTEQYLFQGDLYIPCWVRNPATGFPEFESQNTIYRYNYISRVAFSPIGDQFMTVYRSIDGGDTRNERIQLFDFDPQTGTRTLRQSLNTETSIERFATDVSFGTDGSRAFAVTRRGDSAVFEQTPARTLTRTFITRFNEGGVFGIDDIRGGAVSPNNKAIFLANYGHRGRHYRLSGGGEDVNIRDVALSLFRRESAAPDLNLRIYEPFSDPSNIELDSLARGEEKVAAHFFPDGIHTLTFEPVTWNAWGEYELHRVNQDTGEIRTLLVGAFGASPKFYRMQDVHLTGPDGRAFFVLRSGVADSDVAIAEVTFDLVAGTATSGSISPFTAGFSHLFGRHTCNAPMSPDGKFVYLIGFGDEGPDDVFDQLLVTVSIDTDSGEATKVQEQELFGYDEVRQMEVSKDNNFLYILADNDILVAQRNVDTGLVDSILPWTPRAGIDEPLYNPTHIAIERSGNYLAVLDQVSLDLPVNASNQDIDPGRWVTRVYVFQQDTNTGELVQVGYYEDTELDGPQIDVGETQPIDTTAFFEFSDTGEGNSVIYVGSGRELIGVEVN